MAVILGLNAFHGDSSACLMVDGKIVSAVEEERFRRIKHWAGFPSESISWCLNSNNLNIEDVDIIAVNSDPKANLRQKLGFSLSSFHGAREAFDRLKKSGSKKPIKQYIEENFGEGQFSGDIKYIEHHHAHLASSHFCSPFDESMTVSVDGLGDFVSAAWGLGNKNKIDIKGRIYFPHSLGTFYEALTHFLGFKHYGDEYKVMGLAPLGKPTYVPQVSKLVKLHENGSFELNLDYFSHQDGGGKHTWENGIPVSSDCFGAAMSDLLGPARLPGSDLNQRHMDIAHSVQMVYEDSFFNLINALHQEYKLDQLTLSGGCAMNSVANGKIYRRSNYKALYVAASAGDAGGAVGAAIVASKKVDDSYSNDHMDHAYLGPAYGDNYIEALIDSKKDQLIEEGCTIKHLESEDKVCSQTADLISQGLVIGWFQGHMEWGPRALGNRSILCDPRRADMKDILNLKIKRRESFRPFAPSILRECVIDWFEEEDDVPFMMQVFQIQEARRATIPAVTHLDGSGRLQTVTKKSNGRYYKLISSFNELTGVPILLNTSFNENEPVVCKPDEALNTFLRTKMDVLVLGNWIVKRISQKGIDK